MEVVATEEKKKIFRARKTMKISDRQQLETLHNTLLTTSSSLSESPSPPLMNGTHKEDGQKGTDKEQNVSDSPEAPSPSSSSSSTPFLSLNLSPSPGSSPSPKAKEESTSPTSPFHSINFEHKKMDNDEEEGKMGSSSPSSKELNTQGSKDSKEDQERETQMVTVMDKKEVEKATVGNPEEDTVKDSIDGLAPSSPVPISVSESTELMETDSNTEKAKDSEPTTVQTGDEKPSPKSNTPQTASSSATVVKSKTEVKEEDIKEEAVETKDVNKGLVKEEKMDLISVKSETKKGKSKVGQHTKQSRPSSTPPSNTVPEEKSSTSGLKRTLSEGFEKEGQTVKRDGKRPKMEREELEAQLEVKITAKAGSHHKLENMVQQLVEERLRVMQLTIFDKNFQELKDRVEKIDCATKHQTAINTLQIKIARLSKKFGEANQASENKRKQEALAAAAAATAATAKSATVANSPQAQRPVRTSVEVKAPAATPTSSTLGDQDLQATITTATVTASPSAPPASATLSTSTSTTVVPQAPILQLIPSTSNAASTLATGITTQSPTGTLLLKTAPGNSVVAAGQPLLIQLPLSMANGQTGTLVNIPVSSLSAVTSLNKAKTTAPTTTFILKPAPATTTTSALPSATVPTLQSPTAQVSSGQISLARAVYQGGAGGITTPNAGISVTTARTPSQSVSVAGAMSSASSPATSGPAATGSTAPGPPQGTSLTSKTDNQAAGSTPSKAAAPASRPKGSVIDLTEDDDDVQVTGVTKSTAVTPSSTQRSHPLVISIPSSTARSSPNTNSNSSSNPQLTIHHRPPLESSMKRAVVTGTPTRTSNMALPPLPSAPAPPRLPPEAERTSPPQQPQLKLVPGQTGIVLSWCVGETDRTCAAVESYHLYAFHQDNSSGNAGQQHWKKIGEVKALPLPMACTLTQFQSGSTYHFAVRAKDIYGRFGAFCEPQCTNVINSSSS